MIEAICFPDEHNFQPSKYHYGFETCQNCRIVREEATQPTNQPDAQVCGVCGGIKMVRAWGKWVDCPVCHPANKMPPTG